MASALDEIAVGGVTGRDVVDLSAEDQALIMGGTIAKAMKVGQYAPA